MDISLIIATGAPQGTILESLAIYPPDLAFWGGAIGDVQAWDGKLGGEIIPALEQAITALTDPARSREYKDLQTNTGGMLVRVVSQMGKLTGWCRLHTQARLHISPRLDKIKGPVYNIDKGGV